MAASEKGGTRREKDKRMAAYMKKMGIERTSAICALCYRRISIDSIKSKYKHICPGGTPSWR